MPYQFSVGIGYKWKELILLTNLKLTLKPKCEIILEILKKMEEEKGKSQVVLLLVKIIKFLYF